MGRKTCQQYFYSFRAGNGRRTTCVETVIVLYFDCSIQSHNFDEVPVNQQNCQWFSIQKNIQISGISPSQDSRFEMSQRSGLCLITNAEFRPPPPLRHRTKTAQQQSIIACFRIGHSKSDILSAFDIDRSEILGLAAGGQMYGARDLRLLIV